MRDVALVLHFIGIAMGLGTSFAFIFLGIAAQKLDAAERTTFFKTALALTRMDHIGLTLLLLSGLYLLYPFFGVLPDMPLLLAKLGLFIFLGGLIVVITSKSKQAIAGDSSQLLQIAKLGRIGLLTGVTILILAVLIFH
jgi:hypothetical protein